MPISPEHITAINCQKGEILFDKDEVSSWNPEFPAIVRTSAINHCSVYCNFDCRAESSEYDLVQTRDAIKEEAYLKRMTR